MDKSNININRLKRQVLSNIKLVRVVLISLVVVVLVVCGFFVLKGIKNSIVGTYISAGKDFLIPNVNKIITSDDRVNLLVLGKGDISHDSSELTDTIIVLSISISQKKINLISIPRDIWVEGYRDKINAAYMIGNEKQPDNGGFALAKSSIEEIVGMKIPYAVTVDFNGFKEMIDAVGGIEVDVQRAFTDNDYPIAGRENDLCGDAKVTVNKIYRCRYQTISFEKGLQHMDGDRALIFVRSRHGNNDEGSDTARQTRQQLVMTSLFAKLTKPSTFTNIQSVRNLLDVVKKNVVSDFKINEAAIVARYLFDARGNIRSYTIPENLLFNPSNQYLYFNDKYDHAFVFVPNNNDRSWVDVQNYIKSLQN